MTGPERTRRVRRASLAGVITLAILALPTVVFPATWLGAFVAPAALAAMFERTRLGRRRAFALALGAQIALLFIVRSSSAPLSPLAALGCTLIPPGVYSAIRALPVDSVRTVFLGFCVLLVGAILGSPGGEILLGFLTASLLALAIDVWASGRERLVSWRGASAPRAQSVAVSLQLLVGGLFVCLFAFRALASLPDPVRAQPHRDGGADGASRGNTPRAVGPAHDFEFDGAAGSPIALRSDHLLSVYSEDGHPVPSDLYLRSGAFEIAGLDRWAESSWRADPIRSRQVVGTYFRDLPERRVRVLAEVATDLAFVPAGTFELIDARGLLGSPMRGTFRHAVQRVGVEFEARFHNLHYAELDRLPDPRTEALLQIPPEVERERALFAWILDDARVRHAVEPLQVAEAIASVLRSRCSYALAEPTGPHRQAILNFLDGDHRGFCMHFASAEALALRMLGVPCRIGVGVYGGDQLGTTPNARSYGSQHAHAWVELPIEGAGWIVSDPTPPDIREYLRWPEFAARADAPSEPAATELSEPTPPHAFDRFADPLWFGVAIAIALVIGLGFRAHVPSRSAETRMVVSSDLREARRLMARVLGAHAAVGKGRTHNESLEDWSRRVDATGGSLHAAVRAFQEVRFGGRPLDVTRLGAIEAALEPSADHVE